jgi:carboxypeptidase Taq
MAKKSAFEELCGMAREIALLHSCGAVLGWDQETYLPLKAVEYRAAQLSLLSAKAHALVTGRRFRGLLEKAVAEWSSDKSPDSVRTEANLREWTHQVDRAARIPTALVAQESALTARAKHAWSEARRRSDFASFAPYLRDIVGLARRKAALWGFEEEPYDALLSGYERGAKTRTVAVLFETLQPRVAEIARKAVERSRARPRVARGGKYPVERQKILNEEIARDIGFDFHAGRIDTTAHPFCTTLGPADVRLTTRYEERDFTSSLFGVLHEAGHGLYEQGLVAADYGLPTGEAVSLGIHESQSRLWENHVGRSVEFWQKWYPRAVELFPCLKRVELEAFLAELNRAEFSFIRVEADEATYDLHIFLRFDVERRLVSGELEVEEVPRAWAEGFEALFGVVPSGDAQGCLQDIHWSMGGIGYFATYTLGNVNAAQLFESARRERAVAAGLKEGRYGPLLEWLRNRVHQPGSRYFPQDLMVRATGRATDPKPYLAHLRRRFLGS